jgi:hypothetical protein
MPPNCSSVATFLTLALAAASPLLAQSSVHDPVLDPRDSVPIAGMKRIAASSFGAAVTIIDSTEIASSHARGLSELLTARVPGVSVLRSGGVEGEGSRVALRGPRTLSSTTYPLLIVDGMAVDNTEEAATIDVDVHPSRLDDIPLADIAEIVILPGAVSAGSFGPGAVNGAIVITTKRAAAAPGAGTLQWRARLDTRLRSVPDGFPANYHRTGATPTGQPTPFCDIVAISETRCIPSGLERWNPLEQASPFRLGRALDGEGEVSAHIGWLGARAIVSGDRALGVTSDDDDGKFTGRLNLDQQPLGGLRISEHFGYQRSGAGLPSRGQSIDRSNVIFNGLFGTATDDSLHGYSIFPNMARSETRQRASHTQLGIDGDWQILSWLDISARVGHDRLDQHDHSALFTSVRAAPFASAGTFLHDLHTAEAAARSSYRLMPDLAGSTAIGVSRWTSQTEANDSTPGTGTFESTHWRATSPWLSQRFTWRDRVSLGASARSEQMTELFFGALPRQLFKSVDAAWRLPTASGPDFRLRAAYGEGSQAPRSDPELVARFNSGFARQIILSDSVEKTVEREVGFEVRAGTLASLALTFYSDNSSNLAFNPAFQPPPGPNVSLFNYGSMRTTGLNAVTTLKMIERARVRWDLTAGLSTLDNRVLSLGRSPPFVFTASRIQAGTSLSSYFSTSYRFSDQNHNGIIDPAEVQAAGTQSYFGSAVPTREAFFRNVVTVGRGVTLTATLDYRGGQKLWNENEDLRCTAVVNCRGAQDPTAPLAEQAAFVSERFYFAHHIESAAFTKLREVALEWLVPGALIPSAREARLSIAGLNLATWTRYHGVDPEVTSGWFDDEVRVDLAKSPIPRTVVLRLDLR